MTISAERINLAIETRETRELGKRWTNGNYGRAMKTRVARAKTPFLLRFPALSVAIGAALIVTTVEAIIFAIA